MSLKFPHKDSARLENPPHQSVFDLEVPGLNISYRNDEVVVDFLNHNPEIIGFISLAQSPLVKNFGYPVDIVLEVMTDPDHDGFEELVAWIQSNDDVDEGLEKLERFDDEWFLDHLDFVGNNFSFNIETR